MPDVSLHAFVSIMDVLRLSICEYPLLVIDVSLFVQTLSYWSDSLALSMVRESLILHYVQGKECQHLRVCVVYLAEEDFRLIGVSEYD